ncbi:MAG: NnrU family protein [Rugosibacter sp.]
MSSLIAACALFLGLHWIVSGSPLRGVIVARTGEKPYKIVFSLAVAVSLVWMIYAYAHAPYIVTWGTASALKPLALVLVAFAFILFILGTMTKNLNSLDQYTAAQVEIRGILRITRNPGLIGLGLWGLAHFMVRGDWASHVFFGVYAFQGIIAPYNMERKYHRRFGKAWETLASQSSHIPFVAILTGRNRLVLSEINWALFAVSLALYAIVLAFHTAWFGVSPFA